MKTLCVRIFLLLAILGSAAVVGTGKQTSTRSGDTAKQVHEGSGAAASPAQTEGAPQAKAGDVDTLEHILAAVYDCISGPAGPRDWGRFRSLFYAGARLIRTRSEQNNNVVSEMRTVDEFARAVQGYVDKEGFYESAVANRVEEWDHIAHVWSTYESRHAKGEKPFARGINSFQFFNDGNRWWVVTIYWEGETPGHALPGKYLK